MKARCVWLLAALLVGCVGSGIGDRGIGDRGIGDGGRPERYGSDPTARPPGDTPIAALPFARFAEVPVVLGAAEERTELVLAGLTVRREGRLLRASDGRLGESLTFEEPGRGLRFGERTYFGRLVVSPHPRRGLRLTEYVDLERYVRGVVARELVLWSALPAELEAQAIAVRTYALHTLEQRRRRDPERAYLFDGVEDQAYGGEWIPSGSAGERRVAAKLRSAVEASRGQVLSSGGALLDARFHAACGGVTSALEAIFPRSRSHSPGRACAPCAERAISEARAGAPADTRPLGWSWTAARRDLDRAALAAGVGGRLHTLVPVEVDEGGRWRAVELSGPLGRQRLTFEELRQHLGRADLKSGRIARTWPRAGARIENGLRFDGFGRGHGAGLCQEGARDYAARGWDARRILAHYYPYAELTRLPGR